MCFISCNKWTNWISYHLRAIYICSSNLDTKIIQNLTNMSIFSIIVMSTKIICHPKKLACFDNRVSNLLSYSLMLVVELDQELSHI